MSWTVFGGRVTRVIAGSALALSMSGMAVAAEKTTGATAGMRDPSPAARNADSVRHFDVPASPLPLALAAFGRQAGVQITGAAALTAGLESRGVTGDLSAARALARLLTGTGLTFVFSDDRTVVLERAATHGAVTLDPVTVDAGGGAEERAQGPIAGYVARRSVGATKTDTPIVETPQSISVVTRDLMDDQGSRTVMQAMRYTPGAFTGQVGASNRYDYVILRGLADRSIDNVYLDGLKMMGDDTTYSSMQVDPYFLERIDAIKGPSSVLYGRSSPGGLVALTGKAPLFDPYHEIEMTAGSRDHRGGGFDFSGPVDEARHVAYRLTGTTHASDTQFDHAREERYALAPSMTAQGEDTTLTVRGYLQKDPEGGTHNGSPADGSLFPRNGRTISRHFFDGEPDRERFERDQVMIGYALDHRFGNHISARQNLRYLDSSVDIDQIYQIGWDGTGNLLRRYYGGGHETLRALGIDNQLQADVDTGPLRHTVLAGVDFQNRRTRNDWIFGNVADIDAFNPVYGRAAVSQEFPRRNTRALQQTGLYLQDQIALDHWRLVLGGRKDWASTSNLDRITGSKIDEWRQKITGRAGLLYLFDSGLAPYLSFAESFNPNLYVDASGRPLKPTEGRQYEAGVKYQPAASRNSVTAALFSIDQKNVAVMDPATYIYNPVGTVRSRGAEIEAHLQISDQWRAVAGYAFTDTSYARSPDGNQGHGVPQVPDHMASLWMDYAVPFESLRDLTVGSGIRFVGGSWADRANTHKVPSYTVVDLSLRYGLGALGAEGAEMRLNVTNLLDKTYVASCYELSNCYWGEERTVTGTLSYRF